MSFRRLICRRIADGINENIFSGRITVENGRISSVEAGDFVPEESCDIFFDEDKLLCPAFVDAHGHSDLSLLAMPRATGKTAQGIAWEISGNCGLSPFPLTELNRSHLQELYQQYQIPLTWQDFSSYRQTLQRNNGSLELFPLVGPNTLRAAVAGYEKKVLSTGELQTMQLLLDKELSSGAQGLSLGLLYVPGCFANVEEITALLKVVARHRKICTVHLKSEGSNLEEALHDTLTAARMAGLQKLHLSHLKTAGHSNFHKISYILEALQTPDIRVTGDVYCYDASMTQLSVILPAPYDRLDDVKLMKMLNDESLLRQIAGVMQKQRPMEYWQHVRLLTAADGFERFTGMLLSDAARLLKLAPAELCLQILRRNAPGATGAFHTLSADNMQILAAHASTVPGSDESARDQRVNFGLSHPRGFGNHPEYFALRRRQQAPLGRIIREMSGLPAEIFALDHIGRIRKDCRAVFTVLDPEQYRACSSFASPHELSAGSEIISY